jgi:hypothetical protein
LVTRSLTSRVAVLEPPSRRGVEVPYEVVTPYSNQNWVGSPPALPCARSVAA